MIIKSKNEKLLHKLRKNIRNIKKLKRKINFLVKNNYSLLDC